MLWIQTLLAQKYKHHFDCVPKVIAPSFKVMCHCGYWCVNTVVYIVYIVLDVTAEVKLLNEWKHNICPLIKVNWRYVAEIENPQKSILIFKKISTPLNRFK